MKKVSLKSSNGFTKITLIILIFIIVVIILALKSMFSSKENPEKVENKVSGYLNGTYEEMVVQDENKAIIEREIKADKL